MKKILVAILLLTTVGFTAGAQNTLTARNAPLLVQANQDSRAVFKEKSAALESALQANNIGEAQKLAADVQQMIMRRGDDFLGKDEVKVKQFHDLGYEMKSYMINVASNKEKIVQLTAKVQGIY